MTGGSATGTVLLQPANMKNVKIERTSSEPLAVFIFTSVSQAPIFALLPRAEEADAFEGVDFGVRVAAAYADFGVVVGGVFGHTPGEGGEDDALVGGAAVADLGEEVVDLALDGAISTCESNEC